MHMKEFEGRLQKLGCPENVRDIVMTVIREAYLGQDNPWGKEILNAIEKKLSEMVKDED